MLVLILVIFSCLQVLALKYVNPPFSAYMLRDWFASGRNFKLTLEWAPREKLSVHLAKAVIASEDQRFYEHNGFDWVEVEKAVKQAQKKGKKPRGASTISMQVARNMFLWSDRSWVRKGLEAYYTVLLELFLSKNRILEIYLNIAEMGPCVYGAPAASARYYKQPASRLSPERAARLAIVLPSPKKRSPNRQTAWLTKRKQSILRQMRYIYLEDWPGKT